MYTTFFSAHNSKRFVVARAAAAVVVVLVDVEHFSVFSSFLVFPFSLFFRDSKMHYLLFSMPTAGLSVSFFLSFILLIFQLIKLS